MVRTVTLAEIVSVRDLSDISHLKRYGNEPTSRNPCLWMLTLGEWHFVKCEPLETALPTRQPNRLSSEHRLRRIRCGARLYLTLRG